MNRSNEILGYALAMRVFQNPLYIELDEKERAECDELIRQGYEKLITWCEKLARKR